MRTSEIFKEIETRIMDKQSHAPEGRVISCDAVRSICRSVLKKHFPDWNSEALYGESKSLTNMIYEFNFDRYPFNR